MNQKIRVAIVGVGNCASSLVQGVEFYRKNSKSKAVIPGLMHTIIAGYGAGDIVFSAAFDIDATKVNKDLSDAIFARPNNTLRFSKVPQLGVRVLRGTTLDGIDSDLKRIITESPEKSVDIVQVLRETKTDIVVNYLPTGSDIAARHYANEALKANCGFVNCMPALLANDKKLAAAFARKGLPLCGDDIKSQVGATILHRNLLKLFQDRGLKITKTTQVNTGGNTDFLNFIKRSRTKELSKLESLEAIVGKNSGAHMTASLRYDKSKGDRKQADIYIEGIGFGNAITKLRAILEVEDSPNSAGVVIDAVRCAKFALDQKLGGPIPAVSAYFMKHPSKQPKDDTEAREWLESFISNS